MDTSSQNSNDPLANALDMAPLQNTQIVEPEVIKDSGTYNDDYESARQNLREIAEKGNAVLENLILLADQSQSAKAYEVIAGLISSLTDANERLMDIAIKHKDLGAPIPGSNPKTINNNLFVGSTTELQKLLKDLNKTNESNNDISRKS